MSKALFQGAVPVIGQPGQQRPALDMGEQRRFAAMQFAVAMQRCVDKAELIEAAQAIETYLRGEAAPA